MNLDELMKEYIVKPHRRGLVTIEKEGKVLAVVPADHQTKKFKKELKRVRRKQCVSS